MDAKPEAENRGSAGPRAIGAIAAKLTAPRLGRKGFVPAALRAAWAEIVGPALAAECLPQRIGFARGVQTGGVLHLRVASGAVALRIQHLEPQIRERVNGHFGYAAIARIRIDQGPLPGAVRKPRPAPAVPLSPDQRAKLGELLQPVQDAQLRAALDRLGRRLAGGWR